MSPPTEKPKRGYSRAFPTDSTRRIKLEVDRVPVALATRLRRKLTRTGTSLRALTLRLWAEWTDQDTD